MPIGLYAHIPYCARRCDYCDFFVVVGDEGRADFFEWLARDLGLEAARLPQPRPAIDSVYLGGGTPSLVEPGRVARFLEECAAVLDVRAGVEITLEANPESVTQERAAAWLEAGINRLSLGVQSFSDAVLAPRGRLYGGEQAAAAFRTARQAGLANIGIDLIAGLPGETLASFRAGLGRIAELRPEHVSVYLLETGESGKETSLSSAIVSGRVRPVTDDEMADMYALARERLTAAGYRHYEISNFAWPGAESRHNIKYWRCEPWLGIGPSAHTYMGGRRRRKPAGIPEWIEAVRRLEGSGPDEGDYTLADPEARAREALVLGLRMLEGVDLRRFSEEWSAPIDESLRDRIRQLQGDGLVHFEPHLLRLTERGLLLSNEVFARLA